MAGGALLGGGAAWVAPRLSTAAPSPTRDREALRLLLLVEHAESALYSEALARAGFRGELLEYVKVVGAHEREHLQLVRAALGRAAPRRPAFDFGPATRDPDAFVDAATTLEDLAVGAYNGQGTNVSRATLEAAARIASVEGRHAAWIRSIVGRPPAPAPTEPIRTAAQVRAQLARLGLQEG